MKNKKTGETGIWLHKENPGPLKHVPFISQFGNMKFSKVRMDENMKPHLNDGIEVHFIESGRYEWLIEDKSIDLFPGDLSITAPWHWNGSPTGKMDMGQITWIILKPEKYNLHETLDFGAWFKDSKETQISLGRLLASEKGIVIRNAKQFRKYFTSIKEELQNQESGFELVIRNLLENFIVDLNRILTTRQLKIDREGSFIENLTKEIQTDLSKKWPVEQVAMKFGMGKTKFTELVKKLTGYPPNSFIIQLRIEKAKAILEESEKVNLTDLAYQCGFSSLQHFTTYFSNRTGLSPSQYHHMWKK
mgnify:CR=1 FL=1